jgi:uncharacterized protein YjbJ (UPF0337 family)
MMATNARDLQGQWNRLRAQVRERWGQLTEDDLQIPGGDLDQLVGLIQQKTGEGREAIERFFTSLSSHGSMFAEHAGEALSDYAHQAGERIRDRYDRATGVVRENPAQSLVTAFGVGLVAGLIVGLNLRSR